MSSKLDVLGHVLDRVDVLIIGGGMANTFLNAQGINVGKSLCEHDLADTAREIMAKAAAKNVAIMLPDDVVVAKEFKAGARRAPSPPTASQPDDMILDVGPRRRERSPSGSAAARPCSGTAPWAPSRSSRSTGAPTRVARAAARLTQAGKLTTVAGGGDTVAALAHAGVLEHFSYVSTAGRLPSNGWRARTCPASRHWPSR